MNECAAEATEELTRRAAKATEDARTARSGYDADLLYARAEAFREAVEVVERTDPTEHDPGAANDPPDPDLDACDTVEEVLGWLLNNASADERIEVNGVVEAALSRIEQIMAVAS